MSLLQEAILQNLSGSVRTREELRENLKIKELAGYVIGQKDPKKKIGVLSPKMDKFIEALGRLFEAGVIDVAVDRDAPLEHGDALLGDATYRYYISAEAENLEKKGLLGPVKIYYVGQDLINLGMERGNIKGEQIVRKDVEAILDKPHLAVGEFKDLLERFQPKKQK